MVKQSVIVPEEIAIPAAVAMAEPPAHLPSFPPPRSSSLGLRRAGYNKLFLSQPDVASGRSSTLVDSMRASSPTHPKEASAFLSSLPDAEYKDWLTQHPSALSNFEDVVAASKGKQMVMFLDYDGTLAPIVDDPDRAFMSEPMREAVRDVARHFPTAIVSGRCRNKVFNFVRLKELYYAGSHGMDIKGPSKSTKHTKSKGNPVLFQPASEFLPMMDEVYKALVEKTKFIQGSRVENNTFTLSVHYRCVEEKIWNSLSELVRSVLSDYPELRLTVGRKVLEIRPSIEWDKGKALEFLLESIGFVNYNNVFPVYIGDDRTDEDAFKVLCERGQGVGILVSKFAKETNASYSLQEPSEVNKFLRRLVAWKKLHLKE
ncbi:probable trehalose-phosphate phosphatase 6 [Zingiber officinale]|uniref:Trehalose 6-phosphate phosphatase n=1 Tax=Zingiber officinale TaxID=94328 RepID=A0A8J5KPB5_ZINOF|nr:probable trehalose-phosphate phosphatase 6 [Zingiber officinale]KAG6484113.1 hypothetical protein ZIOFF_060907 [Zingiber officinale]